MALAACGGSDEPVGDRAACSEFNAGHWRSLISNDLYTAQLNKERRALGRQVVRCDLLDGRTRRDVRRLLGPPSDSGRDSMAYNLGPEPGPYPLDQIYLFIDIDEGRVRTYEVAQG